MRLKKIIDDEENDEKLNIIYDDKKMNINGKILYFYKLLINKNFEITFNNSKKINVQLEKK